MRWSRWAQWIVAVAMLAPAASAQLKSPELAERFARGDYLEAAKEAEAQAGADELAFAARALLAQCMTSGKEPDVALIDRATKDAEAALKVDPTHEEGRLQLAIALSLKSRSMDVVDAWSKGYGEKGRKLATEVLKSDPDNYYAHGFLAVWNIEVRRRGGPVGASMMGASIEAARKHYDEAASLAPDDVGIHWTYGRALAALDSVKYGEEAREALARAMAATANDHVEKVMQARAAELSQALSGDLAAAQTRARKML